MCYGSSPLTRGKQGRRGQGPDPLGLIPAHAGKTITGGSALFYMRAHPRSRGENTVGVALICLIAGSSPLTRGKLLLRRPRGPLSGLIPAHAGKTRVTVARSIMRAAHPRSRGENKGLLAEAFARAGSSPLTRGKRSHRYGLSRFIGLIPAHAGKTRRAHSSAVRVRAHPRSRGENAEPQP